MRFIDALNRIPANLMRRRAFVAALAALGIAPRAHAQSAYLASRDFRPPRGLHGKSQAFWLDDSRIFPGYRHFWAIHVPPQQADRRPPALMVFQDGGAFFRPDGAWRTPVVLDNLMAQGAIPPMVAVFVGPGAKPDPTQPPGIGSDRSFEYDSLGPRYSEFLLEEILPLARAHASWSDDPDEHGIGGHSSGAICAFTVAWNRPDQFRKVYSANGSFANIRGGNAYPAMVREQPKRPIRIYQWSDEHDLSRPEWGDWATENRAMAAALQAAGYDHRFDFGAGTHDPGYAAAHFPDALRWLWRA